ncbi:uncharacterized protein EHS24_001847 [Apiotrichum porosum]|uniref:Major facilitator superfamily (MFS) profile domain-containing protein n=1 Tax=Apiotrichum porosum TaxID=105984 RepID=A0A427XJI8_9TREE|nr:uncharacterized protein EHS24_001847 [Apiotrichum porosum]RSH78924.1 hypothetical protein EHS24_001847 [Apiotrichum porosum]
MVSSVGISMVGGTVADLFRANDRGNPMNIFALTNFLGQASGGLMMGWVGEKAGFRWCYAVQCIAAAVSVVLNVFVLRETRAEKLLSRRAQKLTKATGIKHVCKADLQEHKSFLAVLRVSALRPLQFLTGEPIVTVLSIWIGFAWAVIYLGGTATILVFRQYGFTDGQTGSVQACIGVGALIGSCTNYHQEYLYRRAAQRSPTGRAPPEARLYWAAIGGVLFPLGTMVFAWTGTPNIHWIVPAIMLCISYWGSYCMYNGVFNYFADAYETYSSSAQAAQGLARNIMAGIFPLFAHQMASGGY